MYGFDSTQIEERMQLLSPQESLSQYGPPRVALSSFSGYGMVNHRSCTVFRTYLTGRNGALPQPRQPFLIRLVRSWLSNLLTSGVCTGCRSRSITFTFLLRALSSFYGMGTSSIAMISTSSSPVSQQNPFTYARICRVSVIKSVVTLLSTVMAKGSSVHLTKVTMTMTARLKLS